MAQARDRARLHEGTPRVDLHRRMPRAIFTGNSPRRSRAGLYPAGRRGREAAAHVQGTAPCHRRLAVRHLGKYDHSHRHDGKKNRAVPIRHSRPHRGHRQKSRDALEIAILRQMRVRPRARPTTAEIRNSTTAMKKMVLAISTEAPAMPPKPRMPAISAMTKNVTTQLSMIRTFVFHFLFRQSARQ